MKKKLVFKGAGCALITPMKRGSLDRRIGIRSAHIFLHTADEARLAEQEHRDMLRSLALHRCAKVRNLSDNSVIIGDKEQFLHIFAAGYNRGFCMT